MRNFVFVLVVIFAGLTACSSGKRPACVSPVGKLCFSTDKLELGDIYWNEEYRDTIIVRNPTEKTIRLGGWGYTAGVQCRMSGRNSSGMAVGVMRKLRHGGRIPCLSLYK